MEGGALTDLVLKRQSNFSEDFVRWSLYQVALGLQSMHAHNILHRDIKSDNILVRPNGELKLADMGFSVFLSEQKQYRDSRKGTPSWVCLPSEERHGKAAKMARPVCRLTRALYGHPDAGTYLGEMCDNHVKSVGFVPTGAGWPSTYYHPALKLFLVVYADNFKL